MASSHPLHFYLHFNILRDLFSFPSLFGTPHFRGVWKVRYEALSAPISCVDTRISPTRPLTFEGMTAAKPQCTLAATSFHPREADMAFRHGADQRHECEIAAGNDRTTIDV